MLVFLKAQIGSPVGELPHSSGGGELFSQTEQISLDYFDFRVQSIRLNYNLVM